MLIRKASPADADDDDADDHDDDGCDEDHHNPGYGDGINCDWYDNHICDSWFIRPRQQLFDNKINHCFAITGQIFRDDGIPHWFHIIDDK